MINNRIVDANEVPVERTMLALTRKMTKINELSIDKLYDQFVTTHNSLNKTPSFIKISNNAINDDETGLFQYVRGELNAWYKLTNRYDNDRKLIHTEVDRIYQLERSPDRFKDIKNILDASSQVLSNLEGIAQEKEQCRAQKGKFKEKIMTKQELRIEIANNFFVCVIEQKFDHQTSMDFEFYLEVKNIKDIFIDADVVMEFLEIQFRKLQNTSKDKENVSHVRKVQVTTARSGLLCWHCKGNHSIRDCEKLKRMNSDERYITNNKLKMFRNCLLHNYNEQEIIFFLL
ncbi:CLUMA_CG002808, isoform A [Clunio marinus]|uniref:CLUMA_CG002808, isoform A n=1 Tax=Clunio marinus TaxID=568069 RepID=A0A1J1HN12_9DIPT|nr:CLUMA_CG002808, isoform A [Clunio marinus]